jgi:hypothetical protein
VDFARVLRHLSTWFEAQNQPYALIGGGALAAYGHLRTTLDLDFVVPAEIQDELVNFMVQSGYETLHRSSGYSNHLNADPELGRLDFVYVSGPTQTALFAEARKLPGPDALETPVPKPEHLIAMKVQAMKNDPSRRFQDLEDIRFLVSLPDVDRDAVRDRFARAGLEERFRELTEDL